MHHRSILIEYDTARYPFAEILARDVFGVPRLDRLQEAWARRRGRSRLTYQDNLDLRALMQKLPDGSPFYVLYHRWIANRLAPYYANRISYSAHPKMRVHLAGTGCVSDFHCDADITGRDEQINCYLPFTDVHDGCTLYVETDYGSGEYAPLDLRYGQALLWDGGRLRHGTWFNDTGTTRVSCDFRFHPRHPDLVQSPWRDILTDRPSRSDPHANTVVPLTDG
jgi:hypothetical protein